MTTLTRTAKAAWDEIVKPESYVKGDEFEHFVRDRLFLKEDYDLLQWTHDYTTNKNDYAASKEPDFKLKSIKSGREFFVEVKFRLDFYKGAIEWCKPYQLRRYKEIDTRTPLYIVIGVGHKPSEPDHLYLLPLKHIRYTTLFRSFLKAYTIKSNQCIDERSLLN